MMVQRELRFETREMNQSIHVMLQIIWSFGSRLWTASVVLIGTLAAKNAILMCDRSRRLCGQMMS